MSTRPAASRLDNEIAEAERIVGSDRAEEPAIRRAVAIALILHATLLWGRLPAWGPKPVRVEAPAELMQVQFLKPPQPPAPKTKPPEPVHKKVARPDPKPDEQEPETAPPAEPEATQVGPVRAVAGQGPGVIKRVEPIYPPFARAARLQGTVVLDAIILEDGSVDQITVLKSANPVFERSAIDALKQWRFMPGDRRVIMTLTVNFILK
jgi:TonB family protein